MTPKCNPQHFWDRFDNYNYLSNAHYDAIKLKIYSSRHVFCAFVITLSTNLILFYAKDYLYFEYNLSFIHDFLEL